MSDIANDGAAQEIWSVLRQSTQSRIGLGRSGDGLPTNRVLEFNTAHAAARDAVHTPLDAEALAGRVDALGLGTPQVVASRARDRAEYLRRPDLGRLPADGALDVLAPEGADIGIVLADGLSPRALADHGIPLLQALHAELKGYTIAPIVVATQARVALGDHIGSALGAGTVLVLIGERPGLSVADSLGIYLTHNPAAGCNDAQRNCISNIHPPEGLGYQQAARVAASLVAGARQLGRSGVDLKDMSGGHSLVDGKDRSLPT